MAGEAVIPMEAATEPVVFVVGIDNSEESFYALDWILRRHFSGGSVLGDSASKLVVVYARPTPPSVISFGGLGAVDVLPLLVSDLSKIADEVIENARELCAANSVSDVVYEVMEGDATTVLCDAVKKYKAEMLVLGSHGYGAIKRAVMRSIKEYCAHYAECSVLIVKKPIGEN